MAYLPNAVRTCRVSASFTDMEMGKEARFALPTHALRVPGVIKTRPRQICLKKNKQGRGKTTLLDHFTHGVEGGSFLKELTLSLICDYE